MRNFNVKSTNSKEKQQTNHEKLRENRKLNIVREYAMGRISLHECYEKLNDKSDHVDDFLNDMLSQKLDKEFKDYCEELKTKKPQEIIDSAYEIVSKEEIKDYLKYAELHDKEKAIMIDQSDLLTEFYHDWLDSDGGFYESMEYCIDDSISMLTRYYNKQQKFRIESEKDFE